ncbi:hypothetical protein H5410_022844 [Solanum commersonii]|uniref:Uncharacterized protein n=1 Tax=Solanum commersonii TaxID=4109 RepID=A0A9J5ZF70_SOLCO|nr:hypothetical protein H5410_022844 [Solanum commersonii]
MEDHGVPMEDKFKVKCHCVCLTFDDIVLIDETRKRITTKFGECKFSEVTLEIDVERYGEIDKNITHHICHDGSNKGSHLESCIRVLTNQELSHLEDEGDVDEDVVIDM